HAKHEERDSRQAYVAAQRKIKRQTRAIPTPVITKTKNTDKNKLHFDLLPDDIITQLNSNLDRSHLNIQIKMSATTTPAQAQAPAAATVSATETVAAATTTTTADAPAAADNVIKPTEPAAAAAAQTAGADAAATAAASKSAEEGRRLYIGNLAYAATEAELKDFFKDYSV
ncbi:hypothetical protein KEM56_005753, partial [Ascosphaera pollenicola]